MSYIAPVCVLTVLLAIFNIMQAQTLRSPRLHHQPKRQPGKRPSQKNIRGIIDETIASRPMGADARPPHHSARLAEPTDGFPVPLSAARMAKPAGKQNHAAARLTLLSALVVRNACSFPDICHWRSRTAPGIVATCADTLHSHKRGKTMEANQLIQWAVVAGIAWLIFSSMTGAGEWLQSLQGRASRRDLEKRISALEQKVDELSRKLS